MTIYQRKTARRDKHRRVLMRRQEDCGICGQPIDYDLTDHLDPGYFTVDHIHPMNRGGTDTIDNVQAAHRSCNRQKSDSLESDHKPNGGTPQRPPVTYITWRSW